jgi:integrase
MGTDIIVSSGQFVEERPSGKEGAARRRSVDEIIAAWSHETTGFASMTEFQSWWRKYKAGDTAAKERKVKSVETARAYLKILPEFRSYLRKHEHCDLDGADPRSAFADLCSTHAPEDITQAMIDDTSGNVAATIATTAQAWARIGNAANATINRRLAIVSSFYHYALQQGLLRGENPIRHVKREPVQAYASARAIQRELLQTRLAEIDRTTLAGMRDYALILLGLHTGRRAAELAGLRLGHIADGELDEKKRPTIIITWPHVKGGGEMESRLPRRHPAVEALYAWIHETDYITQPDDPIWFSLADNGTRGMPLSTRALSDICKKRLGESQVHKLRHTFAWTMEDAGAKVSDIQRLLGHKNISTTSRYLARHNEGENRHLDEMSVLYGLA